MKKTVCLLLAGFLLAAHGGATGIVKQRMDAMVDIGRAMKTIRNGLDGSEPDAVEDAAARIGGHAGRVPMLFPDGSFHPPSEALPAIASDRAAFHALAVKLTAAAERVASEATAPRQAVRQLIAVFGQCHKLFRVEKRR